VISARVSLRRLEELLIAEERQLEANPPPSTTEPAIVVKQTDFAWDPKVQLASLLEPAVGTENNQPRLRSGGDPPSAHLSFESTFEFTLQKLNANAPRSSFFPSLFGSSFWQLVSQIDSLP
jgi:hypothetical protein